MGEGPRAEARGEPEAVAVEPVDRGVEVGHAEQRGDRPENLLLPAAGGGRHVAEQGRRVDGVRSIDCAAAGRAPHTLSLPRTTGGRPTHLLPAREAPRAPPPAGTPPNAPPGPKIPPCPRAESAGTSRNRVGG